MVRLALTDRMLVDAIGPEFRLRHEMKQLGLSPSDFGVYKKGDLTKSLEGFTDHGLVSHNGVEYYMSTYDRPPCLDYYDYGDDND